MSGQLPKRPASWGVDKGAPLPNPLVGLASSIKRKRTDENEQPTSGSVFPTKVPVPTSVVSASLADVKSLPQPRLPASVKYAVSTSASAKPGIIEVQSNANSTAAIERAARAATIHALRAHEQKQQQRQGHGQALPAAAAATVPRAVRRPNAVPPFEEGACDPPALRSVFVSFARQRDAFAHLDALLAPFLPVVSHASGSACASACGSGSAFAGRPPLPALKIWAHETGPGGQRRFIVAHLHAWWSRYAALHPSARHGYEILREDSPVHLYFDLEARTGRQEVEVTVAAGGGGRCLPLILNPGLQGEALVSYLLWRVHSALVEAYGQEVGGFDRRHVVHLESSTGSKFSRHLLIRLPSGARFRDTGHAGEFVMQLVERLREERDRNRGGGGDQPQAAHPPLLPHLWVESSKGARLQSAAPMHTDMDTGTDHVGSADGWAELGVTSRQEQEELEAQLAALEESARVQGNEVAAQSSDMELFLASEEWQAVDAGLGVQEQDGEEEEVPALQPQTTVAGALGSTSDGAVAADIVATAGLEQQQQQRQGQGQAEEEEGTGRTTGGDPRAGVLLAHEFLADLGVYTRNRAMRLCMSSKWGKGTPLLPAASHAYACVEGEGTGTEGGSRRGKEEARTLEYWLQTGTATLPSSSSSPVPVLVGSPAWEAGVWRASLITDTLPPLWVSRLQAEGGGVDGLSMGEDSPAFLTRASYCPSTHPTLGTPLLYCWPHGAGGQGGGGGQGEEAAHAPGARAGRQAALGLPVPASASSGSSSDSTTPHAAPVPRTSAVCVGAAAGAGAGAGVGTRIEGSSHPPPLPALAAWVCSIGSGPLPLSAWLHGQGPEAAPHALEGSGGGTAHLYRAAPPSSVTIRSWSLTLSPTTQAPVTVVYHLGGASRWCHRIGRHHKGNHTWWQVDLGRGWAQQGCMDGECRALGYRSPPVPVPEPILGPCSATIK